MRLFFSNFYTGYPSASKLATASCRARLPTHRSIKKDIPRGKRGKRGGIRFPEFHSILSFPSVCSSRRPILLRNARLSNVAHAETRRVLRMLSNDGGVGEDDGKRREKFERKKLEEKVEHFSLLDGTLLVGDLLSGRGERSLAREIFSDDWQLFARVGHFLILQSFDETFNICEENLEEIWVEESFVQELFNYWLE